jgi:hypothetical protein
MRARWKIFLILFLLLLSFITGLFLKNKNFNQLINSSKTNNLCSRQTGLNLEICHFLNKQGAYTDKNIELSAIDADGKSRSDDTKLGLVDMNPVIQGVLLDYTEKDGSLILFMGFQGQDGNRFVSPVEVSIYFFKDYEEVTYFDFEVMGSNCMGNPVNRIKIEDNGDEISEMIKQLKGKIIAFQLDYDGFPEEEIETARKNRGGSLGPIGERYVKAQHDKAGLAGKLVTSVATNDVDLHHYDKNYSEERFKDYQIVIIDDIEDVKNIDLSQIPMMVPRIIYVQI